MNDYEKQAFDNLWNYPLFEALAKRRGLRLSRGFKITNSPFGYESEKAPIPLTELETAVLCWAGHGITGVATGDLDITPELMNTFVGRTHPNACNDPHQELMYINDDGAFLYRPKVPTRHVEIASPADREKVVTSFNDAVVKLVDGRPDIPEFALMKCNYFSVNKPGTTAFMPVVDLTYEYMNMVVDTLTAERWQIIDDRNGSYCGLDKWVKNGYLNGAPAPLSMLEVMVMNVCVSSAHCMAMNISLAATAMGLAGWHYGGYVSLVILGGTPLTRGLGFRFVTDKNKMPVPVGRDGIIESLNPPYVKDMDEAVDKFFAMKFGSEGTYGKNSKELAPWKDKGMVSKIKLPDEQVREMAKIYMRYIYKNYGRIPGMIDPIFLPIAYAVHHPDMDFYGKYYPQEYLNDSIKNHLKVWHGKD